MLRPCKSNHFVAPIFLSDKKFRRIETARLWSADAGGLAGLGFAVGDDGFVNGEKGGRG